MTPYKHDETSARRFAREALEQVAPNAVIIADPTPYYPLAVTRDPHGLGDQVTLLGGHEPWSIPRPDEDINAFFAAVGNRPLYVVSPQRGYCPDALRRAATFQQEGLLHRVRRAEPTPAYRP
jgi:hypothetical protein